MWDMPVDWELGRVGHPDLRMSKTMPAGCGERERRGDGFSAPSMWSVLLNIELGYRPPTSLVRTNRVADRISVQSVGQTIKTNLTAPRSRALEARTPF